MKRLLFTRASKAFVSYLLDWIAVGIVIAAAAALDAAVRPFTSEFDPADQSINHTYKPDTISATLLYIIVGPVAAALSAILVMLASPGRSIGDRWRDLHRALLGLAMCISLTLLLTVAGKLASGRPRPDFLARCRPTLPVGSPVFERRAEPLLTVAACDQPNSSQLLDGMKSFPSGHSSLSFAALSYLALVIARQTQLFDGKAFAIRVYFVLVPILGALVISLTRRWDNKHHPSDIIAGAIVGMLSALFSYHHYFPAWFAMHTGRGGALLPVSRFPEPSAAIPLRAVSSSLENGS